MSNVGPDATELYFALHAGTPGDVAFYRSQLGHPQSILELGVGDARLLAALADCAETLVGLDDDARALELGRERLEQLGVSHKVRLESADMCEFELGLHFDAIILSFNTLFCLEGDEQKRRALRQAAKHLKPSGQLLIDVYPIDALLADAEDVEGESEPIVDEYDYVQTITCRGHVYDVLEQNSWWPSRAHLEVRYRFSSNGCTVAEQQIGHSYATPWQIAALLEELGFEAEIGSFHTGEETEPQYFVSARRDESDGRQS